MQTKEQMNRVTYARNKRSYDRIELQVPKGAGPELRRLAAESGARSLGSYLAGIIERETGIKCTLDGEFPAAKNNLKADA